MKVLELKVDKVSTELCDRKTMKKNKDNNEDFPNNTLDEILEAEDKQSDDQRRGFGKEYEKSVQECKQTFVLDLYQNHFFLKEIRLFFQKDKHHSSTPFSKKLQD